MLDSDTEGIHNPGYQSDVMRSLHMLGGTSAVTVKTNRVDDPYNEHGQSTIINVNQIRLNVGPGRLQSSKHQLQQIES